MTGAGARLLGQRGAVCRLEVLEQAITAAGSLDKAAVIDKIKNGTFKTIMGDWKFDNNNNNKFWTVGQWQDGVFQGVASTGLGGSGADRQERLELIGLTTVIPVRLAAPARIEQESPNGHPDHRNCARRHLCADRARADTCNMAWRGS